MRFAAIWFPYWQLTSIGFDITQPAAVIEAGVVTVCSPGAQAVGVRPHQRRREALRHCPSLHLITPDPEHEKTSFEPVLDALLLVVARIEANSPGYVTFSTAEPVRFYGDEPTVCQHLLTALEQVSIDQGLPIRRDACIGFADSRFGAKMASTTPGNQRIVPAHTTAEFLAPLPIETLEIPELATLAHRLGIHTLGQFAALERRKVVTRFGHETALAHSLARGDDPQPARHYQPAQELSARAELDPPAHRIDVAAFAAKRLADDLTHDLSLQGVGCTGLRVELATEHDETIIRNWHSGFAFDAETMTERIRWQIAGWIANDAADRPTAGISLMQLHVIEVADLTDLQLGLWGELSSRDRRAIRGLDRVRGLLGDSSVFTATLHGGRGLLERVHYQPWGQQEQAAGGPRPWPGQLPQPAPAIVYEHPLPIRVRGNQADVSVNSRGELNESPQRVQLPNRHWRAVTKWTGPWLTDELWWEPGEHRRHARFQVALESPTADADCAYLLCLLSGQWWLEAAYD